jgi:hypothetical protein
MSKPERITCTCPDDCNCRCEWRTNYCGCRAHDFEVGDRVKAGQHFGTIVGSECGMWQVRFARGVALRPSSELAHA